MNHMRPKFQEATRFRLPPRQPRPMEDLLTELLADLDAALSRMEAR